MKRSTRIVRDVGAMLSIMALVAMILLEFWFSGLSISQEAYTTLLLLISALLSIDIIRERWVIIAKMISGALDAYVEMETEEDNK